MHKDKLIEYDEQDELVYISPSGVAEVEKNIINKYNDYSLS